MVAQRCCPRSLGVKVGRLEVKVSLASTGRSYLKNIVRTVFHLTRHLSWSGIHTSVFHPFKAQGIPTLCQETPRVVCECLEAAFPLVSRDSENVLRRNYQAHICWIKYNGGNTTPFSALAFCDVPKNYSLRILVKSIYNITQSPSRLWHLCIVAFKDSMVPWHVWESSPCIILPDNSSWNTSVCSWEFPSPACCSEINV